MTHFLREIAGALIGSSAGAYLGYRVYDALAFRRAKRRVRKWMREVSRHSSQDSQR